MNERAHEHHSKRWNLVRTILEYGGNVYTDYEGFYDSEIKDFVVRKTLENTKAYEYYIDGVPQKEYFEVLRDLTSNLLLQQVEVISIDEHTEEEWDLITLYIVEVVTALLSSQWWTKSGIDWEAEAYERKIAK